MNKLINKIKKSKLLICICIFLSVSTISIGYSAFSTKLYISGDAAIRVRAPIRVASLTLGSLSGSGSTISSPKYSKDSATLYSSFEGMGSVHYDTSIENTTSNTYYVKSINVSNNSSSSCIVYNLNEGDLIAPNSVYEFENVVFSNEANASEDVCNITYEFDIYVETGPEVTASYLSDKVIADNGGREFISGKAAPDFGVAPTDEDSGMYAASEGSGTSYYFRGNIDNNYVKYGDAYWRIIRVTADNSVRMIYQGTTADATGAASTTGATSIYITYSGNKSMSAPAPVKTIYGNSTAYSNLNTFYASNLESYEDKLNLSSTYCNDVTDSSGTAQVTSSSIFGDVNTSVTYAGNTRFSNKAPTFNCPAKAYNYSVTGTNYSLTYPVGLITSDEVIYAGGTSSGNTNYYLYNGVTYWTMTPHTYSYLLVTRTVNMFVVGSDGSLTNQTTKSSNYLRPVITLDPEVFYGGGDGSAANPYVLGEGGGHVEVIVDPTPYANTTLVNTVQSIHMDGDTTVNHHTSSLPYSANDDSYRYSGSNPNNFVCFGSDASVCPKDNLYRIIGIIDGKVKLISADYASTDMLGTSDGYIGTVAKGNKYIGDYTTSIPTYAYNNSEGNSSVSSWTAGLLVNRNLSTYYYNTFDTKWKNMIVDTVWSVGESDYFSDIEKVPSAAMQDEISFRETYTAKFGIPYVADYTFSAYPLYWTKKVNGYSNINVTRANWAYLGMTEWTISHDIVLSIFNQFAGTIEAAGNIGYNYVYKGLPVRTTFSINSGVIYTGGTGTKADPMRLS